MDLKNNINVNKRGINYKRIIKIILKVLLLIILINSIISFGAGYYFVSKLAARKPQNIDLTPAMLNLNAEKIEVKTSDGIDIAAWHIKHESPKGLIILLHGMGGTGSSRMIGHSKFLYDAGYSTAAIDMRAHGMSGGNTTSLGFNEPKDVIAVLDELRKREEYKNIPTGIIGISMGAATAIRTTAMRSDIDAIVSISSYADILMMSEDFITKNIGIPDKLAKIDMIFTKLAYMAKYRLNPTKNSPLHDINKIGSRPILLIHGTSDDVVNIKHLNKLVAVCEKKPEVWVIDGAEHIVWKSEDTLGKEDELYRKKVLDFINNALKK